ncbi:17737_t:CDS:10 [Funneliformis caledonium]|uniref:17737_t:CDS:1 n=1 Tax=Funneliformis caledonium TaxID=1117310 RepID=A0A9N8ZW88_9GLOM|nr:17737_t:CDS:10 [Funneliformis caledonium]
MSNLANYIVRSTNFGIVGIGRKHEIINRLLIRPWIVTNSRNYHDDGTFGYRIPRVYAMQNYTDAELSNRIKNANLLRLVYAYRTHGHRGAHIDPLGILQLEEVAALDSKTYGFTDSKELYNLNGILHINKSGLTKDSKADANIETIVSYLKKVYCGKVAYEFMHIPYTNERRWFYRTLESYDKTSLNAKEKRRIFELLTRSEARYFHISKNHRDIFKRYGLEGAESMMVALDKLFEVSNKAGIIMAVLCMPHRGRLNLLTDLLKFSPVRLFHKVKGNPEFPEHLPASGDVLSHLASSPVLDYGTEKPLSVSMLHNPSHLEAVNPVAMGKARAKQMDLLKSETDCELGDRVMCIQLHGDAAFTGQGVVMESFGLSNLPRFSSGGSFHIVVNNQLGYTTPAQNARSSWYSSDIGKMINAPVIHVNGDFPEDVARAVEIAFEYRNKFRKDVIIDLITYRRWGHNELDEPAYTQPLMYANIRSRKSVPKLYEEKLLADTLKKKWSKMIMPTETVSKIDTGVSRDVLEKVGKISVTVPDDIVIHPRLKKFHIQSRLKGIAEGKKVDWATAEALALGSLLLEGHNVRLCGQDVGRGTFSQRHAMMVCQETERVVIPLNNLSKYQGMFEVVNSNLSELAVIGFEYGMSIESPNNLNIWEAQFGDFFNGAQIIIDTYITSGEVKWLRQSGLVMLLPHGYDGAGPEHSSCRIERFLQLSNDRFDVLNDNLPINPNMHIINPTTPAQYFHALRRQDAVSNFEDMISGTTFLPILGDNTISDKSKVEKVVFVCGKLYYDLVKERHKKKLEDKVAIVRVEELCPFPKKDIEKELTDYNNIHEFIWCQEEPQNNGAFTFIEPRLNQTLPNERKLKYVGRPASAAPAVGVSKWHHMEHSKILNDVF